MQKMKLDPVAQRITQMDQDVNIRAKTIKVLEETIGVNLHDCRLCNGFLDIPPKAQAIREKKNKLKFTKTKNCWLQRALS